MNSGGEGLTGMVWNSVKRDESWETVISRKENMKHGKSVNEETDECDSVESEHVKNSIRSDKQTSSTYPDPPMELLSDEEALVVLPDLLNEYILSKCQSSEHCRKSDFDGPAREALANISFIQALQAIEHFAGSVSARIQKRPAYLMGILRGQEQHWDKSRAAASLPGGSHELLSLSPQVLHQVAELSLRGNCVPSDFTPEVCLSLQRLPSILACKAIHAFNSNKRIVAGFRGGVLNRPRFFQRLIQNVAEQNVNSVTTPSSTPRSTSSTFSSPVPQSGNTQQGSAERSTSAASPAIWPSGDSVRTESPPTEESWVQPSSLHLNGSNSADIFNGYNTDFVSILQQENAESLNNYGFQTSSFLAGNSRNSDIDNSMSSWSKTPESSFRNAKQSGDNETHSWNSLNESSASFSTAFLPPRNLSRESIQTLQTKLDQKSSEEKSLREEIRRLQIANQTLEAENLTLKTNHEQLLGRLRSLINEAQ